MYVVGRTQSYVMLKQVIDVTATTLSRVNPVGPLGIVEVIISRTFDWLGM
jgi:hypothetical protein